MRTNPYPKPICLNGSLCPCRQRQRLQIRTIGNSDYFVSVYKADYFMDRLYFVAPLVIPLTTFSCMKI
jgi:hypothetical protein